MDQLGEQLEAAAIRGSEFLASTQLRSGALTDQLANPSRFLLSRRPSRASTFKVMGGADIWHTVSALAALRRVSSLYKGPAADVLPQAESFVQKNVYQEGGLSYWSTTHGLCCETSAFAALTMPALRRSLRSALRRVALPHGRWPQFILERQNGYSDYSAAPSVTGWVLSALHPEDRLIEGGLRYLAQSLAGREIWEGHIAYYLTPLYPAHVASLTLRKNSVLAWVLDAQGEEGGWGYGPTAEGEASVLPTSYALLTLNCFEPTTRIRRAAQRARAWLMARQRADGRFPLRPMPRALWYSGDVYATSMALLALLGAKDQSALS